MALNKKQMAFLDELFINGFNATQAYLSVYKGVSEDTAKANGSKLLANANVKEEYERRQAENRIKYEVNKDEVVEVVKKILKTTDFNPVHTANLKAADLLCKMFGYNATEKSEITIKQERPLFGEEPEND